MSDAPIVRPAPDLGLARALSSSVGPIHGLDDDPTPPHPSLEAVPDEVEAWLGAEGCRTLVDAWDRRACVLRRGGSLLGPLGSIDAYAAWVARYPSHVVTLVREPGDDVRFTPSSGFRPDASSRAELLGFYGSPRAWSPRCELERWTGAVAKDFWFYTPAQASSLPVHVDEQNNLVVQVEGTKHWTLYPQQHPRPLFGFGKRAVTANELDASAAWTVTLEPGDVLLLPRGVPHRAETRHHASLHLDLNLVVPSAIHELLRLAWMATQPAWSGAAGTRPWPLHRQPAGPVVEPTAVDPQERRFWWRATIESDFERRSALADEATATRLRLGLASTVALYRPTMPTLRRGSRRWVCARGWVLEHDERFEPALAALAEGIPLSAYEDLHREHHRELRALEAMGWIECH